MAQADKEMAELFRQSWVVKKGWGVDWPNHKAGEYEADETWARWAIDYSGGDQTSMGGAGGRKFSKSGIIFVTVFSPLGAGLADARDAAQVAIDTYEGVRTPNDVWFRRVRIEKEGSGFVGGIEGRGGGRSRSWWTTLVAAEFIYEYLR